MNRIENPGDMVAYFNKQGRTMEALSFEAELCRRAKEAEVNARRDMEVWAYEAVGITSSIAGFLADDWMSALQRYADDLTTAQFKFVISHNSERK